MIGDKDQNLNTKASYEKLMEKTKTQLVDIIQRGDNREEQLKKQLVDEKKYNTQLLKRNLFQRILNKEKV